MKGIDIVWRGYGYIVVDSGREHVAKNPEGLIVARGTLYEVVNAVRTIVYESLGKEETK